MIPAPRLATIAAVGLASAVLVAAPAAAHTELIASTPADGATVTELTVISLEFSETVLEVGSKISLTDSAGTTTDLDVTQPTSNVIEAPVPPLPNGEVLVTWRAVAEDGHPIDGTLGVTLDAPAPEPSATAPTTVNLTENPSAAPEPDPTSSLSAAEGDEVFGPTEWWMWAIIAVAIVGSGAVALVAAARRNTPPTSGDE